MLHADHEQNCSHLDGADGRLAARRTCSPRCAAGVVPLWGPLHGGANVGGARDAGGDPPAAGSTAEQVHQAGQGQDSGFRLMGFGHRVYKNFDPRAEDPQDGRPTRCSASSDVKDPLLDIARRARGAGAEGPLFRRPQAVPERRLLQRHHHAGDGHPDEHVHRDVRDRPDARLDRAVEGAARRARRAGSPGRGRSTSGRPTCSGSPARSAEPAHLSRSPAPG